MSTIVKELVFIIMCILREKGLFSICHFIFDENVISILSYSGRLSYVHLG